MASRCLGDPAQCHVWAFMVVAPHPLRGELPNLIEVVRLAPLNEAKITYPTSKNPIHTWRVTYYEVSYGGKLN